MRSPVQNQDPWADADIRYYIQEYTQQNYRDGYKSYPGGKCS